MIILHSIKLLITNLSSQLRKNFTFVLFFLILNALVESFMIIITSKFLNIISTDNTNSQIINNNSLYNSRIFWGISFIAVILLTNSKKAIIGLEGFDLKIVGHKEINYE